MDPSPQQEIFGKIRPQKRTSSIHRWWGAAVSFCVAAVFSLSGKQSPLAVKSLLIFSAGWTIWAIVTLPHVTELPTVKRRTVRGVAVFVVVGVLMGALAFFRPKDDPVLPSLAQITGLLKQIKTLIESRPAPAAPIAGVDPIPKPSAPPKDDPFYAELHIVRAVLLPVVVNNNSNMRSVVVNVYLDNLGGRKTTALVHADTILAAESEVSTAELKEKMHAIAKTDPFDIQQLQLPESHSEIVPRAPNARFFTIPYTPVLETMANLSKQYDNIVSGNARVYFLVALKYKDLSMAQDQEGISEICGWFQGVVSGAGLDSFHYCWDQTYVADLKLK